MTIDETLKSTKPADEEMKERLSSKEILPYLEYLLEREGKELCRLQKLKQNRKLDFGSFLMQHNLDALFPQMKTEVDAFLGVEAIEAPMIEIYNPLRLRTENDKVILFNAGLGSLGVLLAMTTITASSLLDSPQVGIVGAPYFCLISGIFYSTAWGDYNRETPAKYKWSDKRISLPLKRRTYIIPTAAHEYTHHIQHTRRPYLTTSTEYAFLCEGHARGVERYISRLYAQKEDNPAFLYDITATTVAEVKSVYLWAHQQHGTSPQKGLLDVHSSYDSVYWNGPNNHAFGNVLYALLELVSPECYKNLLSSKEKKGKEK